MDESNTKSLLSLTHYSGQGQIILLSTHLLHPKHLQLL